MIIDIYDVYEHYQPMRHFSLSQTNAFIYFLVTLISSTTVLCNKHNQKWVEYLIIGQVTSVNISDLHFKKIC